jgi:glycosyltransferase involved in cell wall biosynthesis
MVKTTATKVGVVVQRYGENIAGGAETLARQVAEKFVTDLGWEVEVLTTTASDYRSWANDMPVGNETINGVVVRRFRVFWGRAKFFGTYDQMCRKVLKRISRHRFLAPLTTLLENIWFYLQGPLCPGLVSHLKSHSLEFDRVFFITYLYYPTIWGINVAGKRGILVPTAHDEAPFHFKKISKILLDAPRILALTGPEADLIKSKLPPSEANKVRVVGMGLDINPAEPNQKPQDNKGYVLYLGRICQGKGLHNLIDWLNRYFPELPLHLAGKIEDSINLEGLPNVTYHGFVSEQEKLDLLKGARVVINPSAYESLSILALEAMVLEKPVLLNGDSPVLLSYSEENESVFAFRGEQDFVSQLQKILDLDWNAPKQREHLARTCRWVIEHYSWGNVLKRYASALES